MLFWNKIIGLNHKESQSCGSPSTDSARVWAAAKPTWVNGAMLIQQIQPVNAGPQSRPCSTCWDAHFLKMNAAWKIWQLLMRRLSTVQEPGQTYDSVQGWWTRKKTWITAVIVLFNGNVLGHAWHTCTWCKKGTNGKRMSCSLHLGHVYKSIDFYNNGSLKMDYLYFDTHMSLYSKTTLSIAIWFSLHGTITYLRKPRQLEECSCSLRNEAQMSLSSANWNISAANRSPCALSTVTSMWPLKKVSNNKLF